MAPQCLIGRSMMTKHVRGPMSTLQLLEDLVSTLTIENLIVWDTGDVRLTLAQVVAVITLNGAGSHVEWSRITPSSK